MPLKPIPIHSTDRSGGPLDTDGPTYDPDTGWWTQPQPDSTDDASKDTK